MNKCAVVIPIYKPFPLENEKKSLIQCSKILKKYPFIFVCPENLNISFYNNFCIDNFLNFNFEKFKESYFNGIDGYNKLLLSKMFYTKFDKFEYILIYQLDAWVFFDRLEHWCNQKYDYIGAPWFEGYNSANENSKILTFSGNGGFSLRKVNSFKKILNIGRFDYILKLSDIWNLYKEYTFLHKIIRLPKMIIKRWTRENMLFFFLEKFLFDGKNEDGFFSLYAPKIDKKFKVALSEVAISFAFECQPKRLYELNNKKLPFGCHAWEKYDFDFWRQYIDV